MSKIITQLKWLQVSAKVGFYFYIAQKASGVDCSQFSYTPPQSNISFIFVYIYPETFGKYTQLFPSLGKNAVSVQQSRAANSGFSVRTRPAHILLNSGFLSIKYFVLWSSEKLLLCFVSWNSAWRQQLTHLDWATINFGWRGYYDGIPLF